MKKSILIILSFWVLSLHAQEKFSISGTVSDKSNGETLIGASIHIKGTNIGTTTNEYGFYSLTAPRGAYILIFSYIGFSDQENTIDLSRDRKLNIELGENSEQLNEVVIVAEDTKRVNIETPQMSVNKLSTKVIKQIPAVMGEVDVIKSIQLLPGVTNAGEGASGFNVRGGAEDQNLILLDEAIIYNSSHLFGFFSVFNADAIKDVKLYKGGIPSRFGGRASSILDIRQRDGNSKKYSFTGGIGSISSRLTVEGPTINGKGSFLVSGRTTYANLFLALVGNDNRAGFYDLNFKTNYDINDNNRIFVSGYYGQDAFDLSEAFVNRYGNLSGNVRWNHIFNSKLFSNLSVLYSKYNYAMDITFSGLNWSSDIENYNVKYDLGYFVNDRFKMDLGVSGILYKFNPGNVQPLNETSSIVPNKLDDKQALELATYVSAEHKITSRLTAQYGLRYSNFVRLGGQSLNNYADDRPVLYNEKIGIYEKALPIGQTDYASSDVVSTFGNFEPRLALSYKLDNNSSLKISYNRMAQYLHLISNTTSATPLDVWAPSGKFIKPQVADQYAIGYFRNLRNNNFSIEAEVYYKTVDGRVDYIDGAELIAQNTLETEILQGESRSYGLELLFRKNQGNLTGWLSYTLSKSEQRTPGGKAGGLGINSGEWYNTIYDRTHDVSITGNYKLSSKWSLGANFAFQTGRPVTYPNGQFTYNGLSVATYAGRNTSRLPKYHRLDFSATYTPGKNKDRRWNSEWVFSIYNVYNRSNAASMSFAQNEATGLNQASQTSIYGILPSVTYNFKF